MGPDNFDSETFVIRLNYDTTGTIVQLPESFREKLGQFIKAQDVEHGIDLRCYDNDDYLFVAGLFYHAHNVYRTMGFDLYNGQWIDGCCDIPYTAIRVIEQPCVVTDQNDTPILDDNGMFIPDDKKLNAGISKPYYRNGEPYYLFTFNRYMLQRFAVFLQEVFDKNEELVISLDGGPIRLDNIRECSPGEVLPQFGMTSKDHVLKLGRDLWASGLTDWGYALIRESAYMADDEIVPEPAFLLLGTDDPDKGIPLGFAYSDSNRNCIYAPIRKQIYKSSGFYRYFTRRNILITELFEEAIRIIVYHEFAHIANGHGLLLEADKEYAKSKRIAVCAEQNADDFAMRMMICELLYDTIDGNPASGQLEYTRSELIHKWSIRIFASYLALSWIYRGDDRRWDEQVLLDYQGNDAVQHPLYQFRVYNIVNCAINRLQHMLQHQDPPMTTAEGLPIDKNVIESAINETLDLINSFEANFRANDNDTRSYEKKIRDSWLAEPKNIPDVPEDIPLLFTSLSEQAAKEAAQIRSTWPELKARLKEVGAYNQKFSSV